MPPRTCHCEICGENGNCISIEGWHCCFDHMYAPKPDHPIYHWSSGELLPPGAEDPKPFRAEVRALDELLYPIDHLDFEVDLDLDVDLEPGPGADHT